ncbi:ATP-dependent DNA helicase pif1, partial [Araneus ventricosus]
SVVAPKSEIFNCVYEEVPDAFTI